MGRKHSIATAVQPQVYPVGPATDGAGTSIMLPIDQIDPNPWNPRRFPRQPNPDDESLTASIARHGVQLNLLVRPAAKGRYQLIFGERRLRSAKAAGLSEVPVTARALDDHVARVLTLTENLHRKDLLYLEEADAVAGLVDEQWSLDQVADELGKPLSWVARRRRLLNLTPAWRKLAEKRDGWTASWGASDFEQIAILEADAQEQLLARDRHRLERCTSSRELARLIRSLTRCLSSFPWSLDDADLHPVAGACSSCPLRSSRHPGLFDDQERAADPLEPRGKKTHAGSAKPVDRCFNPVCAAKKEKLFLERRAAQLAVKHPRVLLLQDGWLPRDIPGAVRDYQVTEVKKGTRGALPALVQNGPQLGRVRWVILPPDRDPSRAATRPVEAQPQRKSLAERQEQRWRQRKVHAIGLIKTALPGQAPPALLTTVRLAVVFGTANSNSSCHHALDTALPLITPATDVTSECRRMLGIDPAEAFADARPPLTVLRGSLGSSRSPGGPERAAESLSEALGSAVVEPLDPPRQELAGASEPPCESAPSDAASPATSQTLADNADRHDGAARFWHIFDVLEGREDACAAFLWARTLRLMLDRMTPDGNPRHVDGAWTETQRVSGLAGLNAQAYLDQATEALPDPKSWAKEKRAQESSAQRQPRPTKEASADTKTHQLVARRQPHRLPPTQEPRNQAST